MREKFPPISQAEPISEVIRSAFDLKLDISGAWGYSKDEAIIIHTADVPLSQLEYTLASMRTHIEMQMMLPKDKRYGGINLTEVSRKQDLIDKKRFDIVTYEVSAMKEADYTHFINAYKEGYGKSDFDLEAHFNARKEATLKREIRLYFDITRVH